LEKSKRTWRSGGEERPPIQLPEACTFPSSRTPTPTKSQELQRSKGVFVLFLLLFFSQKIEKPKAETNDRFLTDF
jgi:hypothetical protein